MQALFRREMLDLGRECFIVANIQNWSNSLSNIAYL